MSTQVVVTEYGRPASTALARHLEAAKAAAPLAPVTVVVPSNFAGLAARRMLGSGALGLAGIANVNFFTPFRFAELLAAGQLGARRPLTKPVLGAAVRRALADDPGPFRNVHDHQATERAVAALVGELSNVGASNRQAVAEHGSYATSIVDLYERVKALLADFHDEADVALAAAHRSDLPEAIGRFGHVIWYLPGPLSAPLAIFMRAVLKATTATVIAASTGDQAADGEVANVLRIADVDFAPGDTIDVPLADAVISVTDADEEVRAVVREVIQLVAEGVPLHRIGIFHPVPDPYVRILEQHFAAADVVANGPSRRRLSEMIAGRVLSAALALPSQRWRRDRVIALVNSGPLRHGDGAARPAVWDSLSRAAGVVGGLGDWRAKLAAHAARLDTAIDEANANGRTDRAQRFGDQRADVDDLLRFVEGLAEAVAAVESAKGWVARSETTNQLLHHLLGKHQVRGWWPEPEQAAFEAVESSLERLAQLEEIDPNPPLASFVRALSDELSVARDRNGRFGHGVVYGPLSSAAGHDLDAVFVLGCTEGLCPAPRREDVLLSDNVRRLASGDLSLRLGQIDEQHRLFLAAVAAAPAGRRWLFFPRGDLRSSRRSRPSRWLLPTASKLADRQLFATDFDHENPTGVYEVESHAEALIKATHFTSIDERDVAAVWQHVREGGEATAHPASDLVRRGLDAAAARRSASFTEFDGNIARVAGGLPTDVLSASQLETWAGCGFRYYLRYVLGLGERDDPERTIDLSALDRGSALHAILEHFIEEQIEAGLPAPTQPWSEAQRQRAQEIAHEVFDDYERRGRTGRPIEWQTQKADLLALVDDFLRADDEFRAEAGATPHTVELAFGMGNEPLVVRLDDHRTLRFRGMIDRVDVTERGAMLVTDYKTGKGTGYRGLADDPDPTRAGTLLQLGLYAEAVAQQLNARQVQSEYWMVNPEAGFAHHGYSWTGDHQQRLNQVLSTIADGIEAGVFAAVPGDWQSFRNTYENCTYCPFDSVCPRDRAEQASDKAEAPELAVRAALVVPDTDPDTDSGSVSGTVPGTGGAASDGSPGAVAP